MVSNDTERKIVGSIKLAADDVAKLRRVDVFRVLADALQQTLLTEAAQYICTARPDLVDEVQSCIEDLQKDCWVSSSGSSQAQVLS